MFWDVVSRLEGVFTFKSMHLTYPSRRLFEPSRMLEEASREHEVSVCLVSNSAVSSVQAGCCSQQHRVVVVVFSDFQAPGPAPCLENLE